MTRKALHVATELSLPVELVTQTIGVLAKRGAGKTYTAAVLAEELLGARLPVVVVDPVGVWWGLRAAANGKDPGLPILVMGGDHGDVGLEPGSGELVADLVVDQRLPVVLDLSRFRKGEQIRWMEAFAEKLYRRNRKPLHLILDEADAFAPQRPMRGEERLLGAIEDLVRRGRARGLGLSLITQRAAVLNKNVLTQVQILVALRTIAPQDRAAVDAWIQVHGTVEERRTLMESLPALPVGVAWWWSPGWPTAEGIFQRVKIRRRRTFDSSATPSAGVKVTAPKRLAQVDLEGIRSKMAATIERQKAEDPRELRRRVAELEAALRQAKAGKPAPAAKEKRIEVPVLKPRDLKRLEAAIEKESRTAAQLVDAARRQYQGALDAQQRTLGILQEITATMAAARDPHAQPKVGPPEDFRGAAPVAPGPGVSGVGLGPRSRAPVATAATASRGKENSGVTPARQRILNALAFLEGIGVGEADKTQVALLAGASPRSGAYFNNLGGLRTSGLLEYPAAGRLALTAEGRGAASFDGVPSSTTELHQALQRQLTPAKWRLIEILISVYPRALAKADLAERAGASATSGAYFNNLGALRSLGLIDYPASGQAIAKPVLFLEARAKAR